MFSELHLNKIKKIIAGATFLFLNLSAQADEPTVIVDNVNHKPAPAAEQLKVDDNTLLKANTPAKNSLSDDYLNCQRDIIAQIRNVSFEYIAEVKSLKVVSKRWLDQTDGDSWRLQSRAQWLFLGVYERSIFDLPQWQLQSFKHERKGLSDKHNIELRVDSSSQKFMVDARNKKKTYAYTGSIYDTLNHQLRLQIDVACTPNTNNFTYSVAKRKGLRDYQYQKIGEEKVKTEIGELTAIKLEKLDDDQTTTVWLAPELSYAIVKLVHEEEGDRNSLSIRTRPTLNALAAEDKR